MIAKDILDQIHKKNSRKKILGLYDNNNDIRALYFAESKFKSKVCNIFIEEEYANYAQGHLTCLFMDWFLKHLLSLSRLPNSHIEYGDPVYIEEEKKETITCKLFSNDLNENFTIYNQKIKNKTIIGIKTNQKAVDKIFPELDKSFTNIIFKIEIVKIQIDTVEQMRVCLPLRNFDFNNFFESLKGIGLCEYYYDGFSFSQKDMLGRDRFGCVAIVQKKDDRAYALKLVFHCIRERIDISQLAMKGMHLGGKISNYYIVDYYDTNVRFCYIPNNVANRFGLNSNIRCCLAFSMKMEYIKGKTIESLWEDKSYQETIQLEDSGKSISKYFTEENRAFNILWGVANALLHLQHNNTPHRNISVDSIMIRENTFQAIIFGPNLAKVEQYFGFELEKSEYFPPESIFQHEHTIKYDIYSLGIVLFYMLFGRTLGETKKIIFTHLENQGIRSNAIKNWEINEFLKNMPPEEYYSCLGIPTLPPPYKEYSDLLKHMLHPDPEVRYSPQDIINYLQDKI